MAQETITEYKTVEETRDVTICDSCGRSEEEKPTVKVAINPQQKTRESTEWDVVEFFNDVVEARSELSEMAMRMRSNGYGKECAIAQRQNMIYSPVESSATADVCISCVVDLFDIDVPEGEIEDARITNGELEIDVEQTVVRNYPTFQMPSFDSLWISLLCIIIFPAFVFGSTADVITNLKDRELKNRDIFIFTFGSALWTTIILGIIFSF